MQFWQRLLHHLDTLSASACNQQVFCDSGILIFRDVHSIEQVNDINSIWPISGIQTPIIHNEVGMFVTDEHGNPLQLNKKTLIDHQWDLFIQQSQLAKSLLCEMAAAIVAECIASYLKWIVVQHCCCSI
jgi:hypothetical protein